MSARGPKGKAFLDRPEAGKDGNESARFARNFIAERESAALCEALAAAEPSSAAAAQAARAIRSHTVIVVAALTVGFGVYAGVSGAHLF
ncbi:MAG: hypothetical protein KGO22_06670 [Gammaproteobacteria bacterium]|nr:hypothetical protein [Gammaproteobacteria bacterium]